MSFSSILSTTLILLLVCGGCTPEAHRYIRFPRLFSPGPASYQRAEAVRHDPYPLNDVGPEIVGGRPLAYQQPVNEVERARMAAPRPVPSGPLVAPSWPTQPPPAVAPPPVVTNPPVVTPPPTVTAPYMPAPPVTPNPVRPRTPF